MSTILTDDEIKAVRQEEIERFSWKFNELRYARAIEAAVLAKLAQQSPDVEPDEAFELGLERIAFYTHPAPQQADRQRVPDGVLAAIYRAGFSLVKTADAYELMRLGKVEAQVAAPEAPAQASAAEPQKWSSYFEGDERVSIYESESVAHGEMMFRIDSDFEPGTEVEYRVARMMDGLELLEQRGKWLGDDIIERINELLSDDMAAEEDPLDFSAEDASDLGKLIIGFARERAKVQWYTVDVKSEAKHTYVAGSDDEDDDALAQKGGDA